MADLPPILDRIRRAKRRLALAALLPALPIVGALLMPFPDELPFTLLRWGFIALCVLVSAALVSPLLKGPDKHPAIVALHAGTVCWIYVSQSRNHHGGKAGPAVLELGTLDGQRLPVPLDEARTDEFVRLLSEAAPRALVGWTPERELAFIRGPHTLLQG